MTYSVEQGSWVDYCSVPMNMLGSKNMIEGVIGGIVAGIKQFGTKVTVRELIGVGLMSEKWAMQGFLAHDEEAMKAIVGLIGGFVLIIGTFLFAKEYFLDVVFGIIFFSLVFDNARLRKKLKDLGHPDDLKSRIEAQKAAQN